jgi:hypothetical protein
VDSVQIEFARFDISGLATSSNPIVNKRGAIYRNALLVLGVVFVACGTGATSSSGAAETPLSSQPTAPVSSPTATVSPSAEATPAQVAAIHTPAAAAAPSATPEPPPEYDKSFTLPFELLNPANGKRVADLEASLRSASPDSIEPVYSPAFVSPVQADLAPDELVMGVEINGDARAYPVGLMRIREMVNHVIGDVPVLVTW